MGLALARESFADWIERWSPFIQERFFADFEEATGIVRDDANWPGDDHTYWKLGSYTRYNIFTLLLTYIIDGDFEEELDDDEDIELEALKSFRSQIAPASATIEYSKHFTGTGDSDTIFVPALFNTPFHWDESWVASLPAAIIALESLAASLHFSLTDETEPEEIGGNWDAVASARNIARALYAFFKDSENNCVAYS